MATPLRMPDLGTVEGVVTLVRWLKAEGIPSRLASPCSKWKPTRG